MHQLNKDFINGNPDYDSLRLAFGRGLVDVAKNDPRVVALSADLASSVGFGEFHDTLPERFIEVGVAEQNLVTVASGMAYKGKIPFAASYAVFSPGRNWEQIRTTICLNDQPVKLVGSHVGVNVGADGATHQALEDIALMRVLPNMVVLSPGDAIEAEKMAALMAKDSRPNYIRLPRTSLATFNRSNQNFEIGKAYVVCPDNEAIITIFSTGSMTATALEVARELASLDIGVSVVHVPTIKPLDKKTILTEANKTSIVVTVEEHQLNGGFGSAILELLADSNAMPSIVKRIGIDDQFGQSGTAEELLSHYRLDKDGILSQIAELVN